MKTFGIMKTFGQQNWIAIRIPQQAAKEMKLRKGTRMEVSISTDRTTIKFKKLLDTVIIPDELPHSQSASEKEHAPPERNGIWIRLSDILRGGK